ncbi:MAG TPA: [protein-PII] uridylyltransferase [Nocardioides sp.]|nr:[protein-PII] uridylyltransferase [Nocardioides sp.]
MDRRQRTDAADALCRSAYDGSGAPATACALVAVGGYGRRELAPYSDLDVVLVHQPELEVGDAAGRVWYPIWASGARLDHSVRAVPEMFERAGADLRVALGLLDLRHLAGDPDLTRRLRSEVLAHWRRTARDRLPELRDLVRKRHDVVGELAHLAVPDLKEAEGGLRDATVLTALVATWLVDVPHVDLERSRLDLLDVREALHAVAGRATDRVAPELWDDLAGRLGTDDAAAAQRHVRELGRRITHLSRLTWRRVDAVLARPASGRVVRRPELTPVEPGVAVSGAEVVLTATARPAVDSTLLLRAAAVAAERDLELAPATAARLVAEGAPLTDPWPLDARQGLVRLLAAGPGLLPVWETLEETGALTSFLPEWERIRLLPHASAIHRYTVDRHVVETCKAASTLIRQVARPDVLLVAALLHDIGKGGLTEHSIAGEPLARAIAGRMGFDETAVQLVGVLVRRHLLLAETATTRDPEDPATAAYVAQQVGSAEALALLLALTEADARATSAKAWSSWRAGLVRTVAARTATLLGEEVVVDAPPARVPVPDEVRRGDVAVEVSRADGGARVTVLAPDRVGLLADAAALFALQRASVRSARAWAQGDVGVSVWEVAEEHLDARMLRQRLEAIASGRIDLAARVIREPGRIAPSVVVRPEASARATVLEVRTADRPGVVHLVCAALARLDLAVRSAHVDTLGPQAVDVFYVQEPSAGALSDSRAAEAAHAVRAALSG